MLILIRYRSEINDLRNVVVNIIRLLNLIILSVI